MPMWFSSQRALLAGRDVDDRTVNELNSEDEEFGVGPTVGPCLWEDGSAVNVRGDCGVL